MNSTRRAVIDVGTNSIKLLVADVAGHDVRPLVEESKQTRLGKGFYETHRLLPEAIAATAQAVARFAGVAREWKAASIRVVATSAARDAVNPEALTSAIAEASGLKVEIISGDQEAEWAFRGVTTDPRLASAPILLLDAGGGSTEFILGQGEKTHFRASFSLGTVRLMETLPHGDPPSPAELASCRKWLKSFLEREVRPALEPALKREKRQSESNSDVMLVGTGGTVSILARMEKQLDDYDREKIEATTLSIARVEWHVERLWSLPLEQRKEIPGLPKRRADVILTGALIYEAIMKAFSLGELHVSTRGLRFAAVMQP
jgi:exopolyphosphatase/guanosine-5'-triphosphate,3'-diphosphate pyrophosphatase